MARWVSLERRLRRRLAANVRGFRETQGLTLEEAAHRGELSWRHLQKVEAGEVGITLRTLAKLAEAFEVEPIELLR